MSEFHILIALDITKDDVHDSLIPLSPRESNILLIIGFLMVLYDPNILVSDIWYVDMR